MRKNDICLIIGILLVTAIITAAVAYVRQRSTSDSPVAVVTIDGEEYISLPLSQDTSQRIELADGSFNTIVIEDGSVSVAEASCRDQICVRHNPVQYNGETIVCLPNKLVVRIVNSKEYDIDGATY